MHVEIFTECYNERRYGKPYIATTSNGNDRKFGTFIGVAGDPGILTIDAEPGDIVIEGQKDLRRNNRSNHYYAILNEDGTMTKYDNVRDAILAQREFKRNKVDANQ